jgi:hypothetical protein
VIQGRDDTRSKRSPPFEERSQGAGDVLSLAGDIAARFEAGADSSVGVGRAQHPVLGYSRGLSACGGIAMPTIWTNRHQKGLHAGPAPCWPRRWARLTSNMSGGPCAATRLTSRLASPGVRATTRTLRPKPPMLLASMSPRLRRPLCYAWTKSLRSRLWSDRRAI